MDHLINILQTDRYVVVFVFFFGHVVLKRDLCFSLTQVTIKPVLFFFNTLLLPAPQTGLTLKSLAMLWTHCTTSSATMRRKSKVLNARTIARKYEKNYVATVNGDWAIVLFCMCNWGEFMSSGHQWFCIPLLCALTMTAWWKDSHLSFLFHGLMLQMNQKVKLFDCMMPPH